MKKISDSIADIGEHRLLTITDVCELTQLSPDTIARHIKRGLLKTWSPKGVRVVRIRFQDYVRYVSAERTEPNRRQNTTLVTRFLV